MTIDNPLIDELKEVIANGNVLVVVGAGVSISATSNAPTASWKGLLLHGVEYCRGRGFLDADEAESAKIDIESNKTHRMLLAAERISQAMGAPKGGEYSKWLRETIGKLIFDPAHPLLTALKQLNVPVLTTNYDDVLAQGLGRKPYTWQQSSQVELILRGDATGIIHLHGYWEDSESVILGIRSYEAILGDAKAQNLMHALRTMKTLLFIGCGAGLDDPNFSKFLTWTRKIFPGSEYQHFRLICETERAEAVKQQTPEDRIHLLSYGATHDDLAPFLCSLAPVSVAVPSAILSPTSPLRLPPKPAICEGREKEIAGLVAGMLADPPRPMVVLGGAGMGKTTITLMAAYDPQVVAHFGERRYFVRCDAMTDRLALVAAIAEKLGLPAQPQIEPAVMATLAAQPSLLILDNAETPWHADTTDSEELFAALAQTGATLVLSIRGKARPLGVSWAPTIQTPSLALDAARSVFLQIAGESFTDDPLLDHLLCELDGVPLAIILLACAAEGEPNLGGIHKRWQDERTNILTRNGSRNRLENLEASYELSINLPSPRMTIEARRLLALLALLPDGIAHQNIEVICPDFGLHAASLLRKVALAYDEEDRLRMLNPLRQYVQSTYQPVDDDLAQLCAWYFALARKHSPQVGTGEGDAAVKLLYPESANMEKVLLRGLAQADPEPALRAAIAYAEFMRFTGQGSTALLCKCVEIAGESGNHLLHAHCLKWSGNIDIERSDHARAQACYMKALPLYREVGDVLGQADCIASLGNIALRHSDYARAQERYDEALPLYQQEGGVQGEANCIQRFGDIALQRRNHAIAQERYAEASLLYRKIGDMLGEANNIKNLGDIALEGSDYAMAQERYVEAQSLYQQVGDVHG
ncbi:MAG: SIR2 family protein, partial [bacterium]